MRFLVCGVGSIGSRHLDNIRSLGYEDIHLLRTGRSTLPAIAAYKDYPTYSNLSDALALKPDVCVVSNPTSLHVETALTAAKAGCHLFIEKPLSHNCARLDELAHIVEKRQLVTLVAYQFRYHPQIKLIKNLLLNDDVYGTPIYTSAEWSEFLPDWHPWEDYRKSYSARNELGGGVLLTQIHPYNYLSFLFGQVTETKVISSHTNCLDIPVDDSADIFLRFSDGFHGHVHVDFHQKPRVHTLKVSTTKGRFEWDCHAGSLSFIDHEGVVEDFCLAGFERNDMFKDMMAQFIKDVRAGHASGYTLSEGVSELKALLGAVCE